MVSSSGGGGGADGATPRWRAREAIARAEALRVRADRTVRVSLALRADIARRAALDPDRSSPPTAVILASVPRDIVGFHLRGRADGRTAEAMWQADGRGLVLADEVLLTRARLLADLGWVVSEQEGARVATLSGPPHAVFLTLLEAFDEVTAADVDLPAPGG